MPSSERGAGGVGRVRKEREREAGPADRRRLDEAGGDRASGCGSVGGQPEVQQRDQEPRREGESKGQEEDPLLVDLEPDVEQRADHPLTRVPRREIEARDPELREGRFVEDEGDEEQTGEADGLRRPESRRRTRPPEPAPSTHPQQERNEPARPEPVLDERRRRRERARQRARPRGEL